MKPAPSPKPRPNPKILAPQGYSISSNALKHPVFLRRFSYWPFPFLSSIIPETGIVPSLPAETKRKGGMKNEE
jgi:hypothetical protein